LAEPKGVNRPRRLNTRLSERRKREFNSRRPSASYKYGTGRRYGKHDSCMAVELT